VLSKSLEQKAKLKNTSMPILQMAWSMAQDGSSGLDVSAKRSIETQVVDYITNFLTFYKEEVEKLVPELKSSKEKLASPPLFKGIPCEVKAYHLPNRAVCALFKYNTKDNAKENKVEVAQADYSKVRQILEHEPQNNFMIFPPFKIYTKESSLSDAKHLAECDLERHKLASECNIIKGTITEVQAKYAEIAKANPWLEKQFKLIQDAMAKVKSLIVSTEDSLTKFDTDEKYGEYDTLLALTESIQLTSKLDYKGSELEKYIKNFIKHYRDIHSEKTSKTKVKKLTPFYAGYPYSIRILNLENGTVWFLFKYRANALSIETSQLSFQEFESKLMKRDYDYFLVFMPGKNISTPDKDAKAQVEYELAKFDARSAVEDAKLLVLGVQKKTNEIMKTNPWLDKQFKVILDLLAKSIQPLENLSKGITQIEKKDLYYRAEQWHIELKTYYQKEDEMKVIEINLADVQPSEENVFFEEIEEETEEKTTFTEKTLPQAVSIPPSTEKTVTPQIAPLIEEKREEKTTFTEKTSSQAVSIPSSTEKTVTPQIAPLIEEKREEKTTFTEKALPQAVSIPPSTEKTVTPQIAPVIEEKREEKTTFTEKALPQAVSIPPSTEKTVTPKIPPIIEEKTHQQQTAQQTTTETKLTAKVEQSVVQEPAQVAQPVTGQDSTQPMQKPAIDPEAEAQAQIIRQLENLLEKQQSFASGPPQPFPSYNGESKDEKNLQSYSTETVPPTVQEYTESKIETFRVDNPYANLTATPEQVVTPQPSLEMPYQADVNELKSKLYQQEKKLSDFQRKLEYMEKYMEKVQETQNKKFEVMEKLIEAKIKRGRYNGVIIAIVALSIAAFTAVLVLFPGTIPIPHP